ncbi:MAG: hypothetical protein CMN05_10245 [Roseibacillus sp.]|jgi:hypothetical protein|nr:hypothetical protein [Roseibacillus sp.]MCP4730560.1 DUF1800 family protein [Roseibacillus sp.]MDP7309151.1 DUF1800 family protein [Roseibacillus sp.]HJM64710.1 DUF1800 family protein [Roseibacillus sp.]|tara:strand:- start:8270 stop:10516 length:2247 start_codon:yes stop_codon:yes gene_type:complete
MKKRRREFNWQWLAVVMVSYTGVGFGQDEDDLTKANAALKQAQEEEKTAYDEHHSRDMARAATLEIARSERRRAEGALLSLREARKTLEQIPDAAKGAPAQKNLSDKIATSRKVVERLVPDSTAADKAAWEWLVSAQALRDKTAARTTAQRNLQDLKANAAEKAGVADADAMRRAVYELEALRAFEITHWATYQRANMQVLVTQTREAARIAKELAAAETDPERVKMLEQFAAQEAKEEIAAAKSVEEAKNAEIGAAISEIYPLKAAAMGGLKPLSPDDWDYAKARHLLVRAGFGGTPQEVKQLHSMGLYKAVAQLVEYYRQPAARVPFDPVPPLAPDLLEAKVQTDLIRNRAAGARRSVERGQVAKLRQSWLKRMVESPRPLQEKLTLFWHGHFATQDSVVNNSYTLHRQIQFLRENAGGNFGALLYGIVHDPAMIRFLDNNKNLKGEPNENLAREIMELFAMGVDQGYTEKDIIEGARALTGYNLDQASGGFRFLHNQHDLTDKTIFGQTGPWTGDDLVRLILKQPSTSRFIAWKLFEYFTYRDPAKETVENLALVLRTNNYALEPLLRNLFMSEEFYSSRAIGNQVKSPVALVVGLLRDLGANQLTSYAGLDSATGEMGQQLLEPPDVKGWRYGRSWINSQRLFIRYNTVSDLVKSAGRPEKKIGVDVLALLEKDEECDGPGKAVDLLARACLARPLNKEKREKLVSHLGDLPPRSEWSAKRTELNAKLRELLVLMLSMPEYQMT